MNRRFLLLGAAAILATPSRAAAQISATLYKDASCGCCGGYANYLRANGFQVKVIETDEFAKIGRDAGVPAELEGCHTTLVDGYAVSGHVPMEAVRRLLAERPAVAGIALAGMPAGSPGMGGTKKSPFQVYAFAKNGPSRSLFMEL